MDEGRRARVEGAFESPNSTTGNREEDEANGAGAPTESGNSWPRPGTSPLTTHPIIVTEQLADPVELVFQAFLRLAPEQRARLIQRLKGRVRSSSRGAFGWLTGSERQREAAMTNDELRNKNAELRNKIQ
jgi:hypothetical protein